MCPINIRVRQALLVLCAAVQCALPGILGALGKGTLTGRGPTPLITPAGYAFVIWGAIVVARLLFSVLLLMLPSSSAAAAAPLATTLTLVFIGFDLWLLAAQAQTLLATLVIFVAMLTGLVRAYTQAQRLAPLWPPSTRVVANVMLGLYTGWTTIAVFANLAALIAASGAPVTMAAGIAWQAAVLVAAAGAAIAGVVWRRGDVLYTAPILWALAAVLVAVASMNLLLASVIAVALAGVVGTWAVYRLRFQTQPDVVL